MKKYNVNEIEFFSHFQPDDSKWFRASVAASQGLIVLFAGMLIVWSIISFGQN